MITKRARSLLATHWAPILVACAAAHARYIAIGDRRDDTWISQCRTRRL